MKLSLFAFFFLLLAAEKVIDLLQANSSYSTVSSLLNSSTLLNVLNEGQKNYTIFAPDGTILINLKVDQAFEKVPKWLIDTAKESKVLSAFGIASHLTFDEIGLNDTQCCQILRVSTLIGTNVTILKNSSDVYVADYKVVWKEQADDGLILGIDAVLNPMKHHMG